MQFPSSEQIIAILAALISVGLGIGSFTADALDGSKMATLSTTAAILAVFFLLLHRQRE